MPLIGELLLHEEEVVLALEALLRRTSRHPDTPSAFLQRR